MATVTVLGLGNMGAALADAFRDAGHATTGWTRSGRTGSPDAACAPSDLIVGCVLDYDATYEVLAAPGVTAALRGKTFVQLATGGPADARAMAEWAGGEGVAYLDGSIATYPARIGDEPTIIFYSGERDAFDRHRATLAALGGKPTFVGEAVGGAAAADLAWLSFLYGNMIGLFQGAAFLEAEGVDPSAVFDSVPLFGIEIAAEAALARDLIARNDFSGDQAALYTHLAGMEGILAAAEQAGVNSEFPRLVRDLTARAVDAGHREHEIAALIEILRRS